MNKAMTDMQAALDGFDTALADYSDDMSHGAYVTLGDCVDTIRARLAELESRCETAEADARRYEYLKEICCGDSGPGDALALTWIIGYRAGVDTAIDAAIAHAAQVGMGREQEM